MAFIAGAAVTAPWGLPALCRIGSGGAAAAESASAEAKQAAKEVLRSAHLNLAQCHIKQKDWRAAAKECSEVLTGEPYNVKALYRRYAGITR